MKRPLPDGAAFALRALLYIALSALCALLPLVSGLCPDAFVDVALRAALWFFVPAIAFVMAAFFAYHGLYPLFVCLPPGVCYLLLTPALGMRPMPGVFALLLGLSLIAACGGWEARRRKAARSGKRRRKW